MSLRFVCGRAGSGKTCLFMNEIKASIENGASYSLILLVPEQFTFQAERDVITVLGSGGILKVEVLSFKRMAFRVFNDAGGITYPHIHPAGKCMILYKILDEMRDSLKVFGGMGESKGFINKLSALITEFKRYNISCEDLAQKSKCLDEKSLLKTKLAELNMVCMEFEKALANRYRNADDDLTQLSRKLEQTSLYDGAEIWIDGFSGFTPQEYEVIGKLMKKARRVHVSLCTDYIEEGEEADSNMDVFFKVKQTYRRLVKIANKLQIEVEPPVLLNCEPLPRFKDSPELSHLERNFYAYPPKEYKEKTRNISLSSFSNVFTEVEAVARDIVRLCRDANMRYRDIAVFVRNFKAYDRLIEVIFAEHGIPCFIDKKIKVTDHPLVRLILSMLDIFIENWSYESVFRYLKTGLTGIDRESIDRIENYVLACGIKGSRWTDGREWNMNPEIVPSERRLDSQDIAFDDINKTRLEITSPLLKFREKTRGRKEAREILSALYDFLCDIDVPERLDALIKQFREEGRLNLANEYSQVWNIVMDVFDQMAEVMGDGRISLERFANILKIGFDEYSIGLIPASLDQVLVGSIDRIRTHEIKTLYILGTNDGIFPSAIFEEGILSDMDREILNNMGIELASDTKTKVFEEQFLVYRALTATSSYLRISWPIADHEGKSMRPSLIISRMRKLFPEIDESSDIIKTGSDDEEKELIAGTTPTFKQMVSAIRRKADGKHMSQVWKAAYRWFYTHDNWLDKCKLLQFSFSSKNIAEPVSKEKIALLYGKPASFSISRVEKYAACPFAYYIQYGLKAKERRVYQLSSLDIGNFVHLVIERFSEKVADEGISWADLTQQRCSMLVSDIVDKMLDNMRASGVIASKRVEVLITRLKRIISRAAWVISEHMRRGNFIPLGHEIVFDENGNFPPIVIELDSGERIKLTGRIDRLDVLKTKEGTYVRVVDYKSGSRDFKLSDLFHGLQVQLIAYLDAIWESKDAGIEPPIYPGGILYFRVDDPIVRGSRKNSDEEIDRAIMKQLKMNGLLLADVNIIREMDKNIEGASLIIPARINKDGMLGAASAASREQFALLGRFVKKLLRNICREIMKGDISIRPYKKKDRNACEYCEFSSICQFDPSLAENAFRLVQDKKDEEMWTIIKDFMQEAEVEHDGQQQVDR